MLLEYSMNFKLLTEQHFEFLSLTGGCRGSSESTLVIMPHSWKSHVAAQLYFHMAPLFRGEKNSYTGYGNNL